MSLGARIFIAAAAALFGLIMFLHGTTADPDKAWFSYAFGAFCLFIAAASVLKGRAARFCGSVVGSCIFVAGLCYLGYGLFKGHAVSATQAEPSILNAGLFMMTFGIPGLIYAIKTRFGFRESMQSDAMMSESSVLVTADEAGIAATYPNGKRQSINWSQVQRITIETNDSGPWGADVWWLFEGSGQRCAYPQGATGDVEVLKLLPERFPGFSDEQVVRAMGCTSNARFICWERASPVP
jgi:hypothetical protein